MRCFEYNQSINQTNTSQRVCCILVCPQSQVLFDKHYFFTGTYLIVTSTHGSCLNVFLKEWRLFLFPCLIHTYTYMFSSFSYENVVRKLLDDPAINKYNPVKSSAYCDYLRSFAICLRKYMAYNECKLSMGLFPLCD